VSSTLTADEMMVVLRRRVAPLGRGAELARIVGIAHSHIGMVKRGDRPISARIARALGYERLTEQVSVFTVVRRSKRRYVYRRIEPAN